MTTPTYGVIPPHPPPPPAFCNARDEVTGRVCDLEAGHDGDHESIVTLQWPREDP